MLGCVQPQCTLRLSSFQQELTRHCLYSAGSLRMVAAMRAPCAGGLLYIGRMVCGPSNSVR